jgi:hypothetical protein
MNDKQNAPADPESPGTDDEQSQKPNGSEPKSYYYDDSTGYEIYEDDGDDAVESES